MNVDQVLAELRRYFERDARGAIAVYLYGSTARGDAGPSSDVDLGVLFESDPQPRLESPQFALEAGLERLLLRRVQVVALNRASSDLVHRVLRDGRLVLDRDKAARVRFEVRSRNEYFDMARIRALYRRYPVAVDGSASRTAENRR